MPNERVTITPQRKRGDLPAMLGAERLHVQFVDEPAETPATYYVLDGEAYYAPDSAPDRWVRCRNHALLEGLMRAAGVRDGKRQTVTTDA